MTANPSYLHLLGAVLKGQDGPAPRGLRTRELLAHTTVVNMVYPVVTIPERKLSHKFMGAEALWILSGSRELAFHRQIAEKLGRYSDDGWTLRGAYGPQFLSQYQYVVDCLCRDRDTRQAVLTLWAQNPRDSKDIPCTVSAQFLIREMALHMIVFMRSSDAWLGWPYDVFSFTMMATFIALHYCTRTKIPIYLGQLRIVAGSQHLYQEHFAAAEAITQKYVVGLGYGLGDYGPMTLSRHNDPENLLVELRNMANEGIDTVLHK